MTRSAQLVMTLAFVTLPATALATAGHRPTDLLPGHWDGAFSRNGSIQLVAVDFRAAPPTPAGEGLLATYDMPELGLFQEPARDVAVTDSSVTLHLIYGVFALRFDADDLQLTAENRAWGPPVSLHLHRAPKIPFYDTLAVAVPRAGAVIRGTLYLPRSRRPVPGVVVAGGSTQTTRSVWEYRGWGPVLARRGIATLVYDRRGRGASTGDTAEVDLRTEAADVLALVAHVKRWPGIDPRRVGLVGLSRGGWVASWAAARSAEVRFIALECAPAVSAMQQELQRVRHADSGDSLTATDFVEAEAFERMVMRAARDSVPWSEIQAATPRARVARWRDIVQIPDRPADLDWWRRNEYDQSEVLARIRVPVLALFGEADRLVPAAENAALMERELRAAGNSDVSVRTVPGAPHGLYRFGTLRGNRWEWPDAFWVWAAKAPGVFEQIGDWILAR